jgi:ABC-2 type transport system ATP-binding protein
VHNLVVNHDGTARFDVDTAALEPVHRRLAEAGVVALTSTPPTLEELFLRHYGADAAGSAADDAPEPVHR